MSQYCVLSLVLMSRLLGHLSYKCILYLILRGLCVRRLLGMFLTLINKFKGRGVGGGGRGGGEGRGKGWG